MAVKPTISLFFPRIEQIPTREQNLDQKENDEVPHVSATAESAITAQLIFLSMDSKKWTDFTDLFFRCY